MMIMRVWRLCNDEDSLWCVWMRKCYNIEALANITKKSGFVLAGLCKFMDMKDRLVLCIDGMEHTWIGKLFLV